MDTSVSSPSLNTSKGGEKSKRGRPRLLKNDQSPVSKQSTSKDEKSTLKDETPTKKSIEGRRSLRSTKDTNKEKSRTLRSSAVRGGQTKKILKTQGRPLKKLAKINRTKEESVLRNGKRKAESPIFPDKVKIKKTCVNDVIGSPVMTDKKEETSEKLLGETIRVRPKRTSIDNEMPTCTVAGVSNIKTSDNTELSEAKKKNSTLGKKKKIKSIQKISSGNLWAVDTNNTGNDTSCTSSSISRRSSTSSTRSLSNPPIEENSEIKNPIAEEKKLCVNDEDEIFEKDLPIGQIAKEEQIIKPEETILVDDLECFDKEEKIDDNSVEKEDLYAENSILDDNTNSPTTEKNQNCKEPEVKNEPAQTPMCEAISNEKISLISDTESKVQPRSVTLPDTKHNCQTSNNSILKKEIGERPPETVDSEIICDENKTSDDLKENKSELSEEVVENTTNISNHENEEQLSQNISIDPLAQNVSIDGLGIHNVDTTSNIESDEESSTEEKVSDETPVQKTSNISPEEFENSSIESAASGEMFNPIEENDELNTPIEMEDQNEISTNQSIKQTDEFVISEKINNQNTSNISMEVEEDPANTFKSCDVNDQNDKNSIITKDKENDFTENVNSEKIPDQNVSNNSSEKEIKEVEKCIPEERYNEESIRSCDTDVKGLVETFVSNKNHDQISSSVLEVDNGKDLTENISCEKIEDDIVSNIDVEQDQPDIFISVGTADPIVNNSLKETTEETCDTEQSFDKNANHFKLDENFPTVPLKIESNENNIDSHISLNNNKCHDSAKDSVNDELPTMNGLSNSTTEKSFYSMDSQNSADSKENGLKISIGNVVPVQNVFISPDSNSSKIDDNLSLYEDVEVKITTNSNNIIKDIQHEISNESGEPSEKKEELKKENNSDPVEKESISEQRRSSQENILSLSEIMETNSCLLDLNDSLNDDKLNGESESLADDQPLFWMERDKPEIFRDLLNLTPKNEIVQTNHNKSSGSSGTLKAFIKGCTTENNLEYRIQAPDSGEKFSHLPLMYDKDNFIKEPLSSERCDNSDHSFSTLSLEPSTSSSDCPVSSAIQPEIPTRNRIVIPEKSSSSSRKVHPSRECHDICSYCFTKFGSLDTPCHIANVKCPDKKAQILECQPQLASDSCLCDACFRHVVRRPDSIPRQIKKKKKTNISNVPCVVTNCEQTASHAIRKKCFLKIRKIIGDKVCIKDEKLGTNSILSLCVFHYKWIDLALRCFLCGKRVQKNTLSLETSAEKELIRKKIIEEDIRVSLHDVSRYLCKQCKYFSQLLIRGRNSINHSAAAFFDDYKEHHLEEPLEEEEEVVNNSSMERTEESLMNLSEEATEQTPQSDESRQESEEFAKPWPVSNMNPKTSVQASPDNKSSKESTQSRLENSNSIPNHPKTGQTQDGQKTNILTEPLHLPGGENINISTIPDLTELVSAKERISTQFMFDEPSKRLFTSLMKPYGNCSSFLRHLVMMEKYYRQGNLVLKENAKPKAVKYFNSVSNRLNACPGAFKIPALPNAGDGTSSNKSSSLTITPHSQSDHTAKGPKTQPPARVNTTSSSGGEGTSQNKNNIVTSTSPSQMDTIIKDARNQMSPRPKLSTPAYEIISSPEISLFNVPKTKSSTPRQNLSSVAEITPEVSISKTRVPKLRPISSSIPVSFSNTKTANVSSVLPKSSANNVLYLLSSSGSPVSTTNTFISNVPPAKKQRLSTSSISSPIVSIEPSRLPTPQSNDGRPAAPGQNFPVPIRNDILLAFPSLATNNTTVRSNNAIFNPRSLNNYQLIGGSMFIRNPMFANPRISSFPVRNRARDFTSMQGTNNAGLLRPKSPASEEKNN